MYPSITKGKYGSYYSGYSAFIQDVDVVHVFDRFYVSSMPWELSVQEYIKTLRQKDIREIVILLTESEIQTHHDFSLVEQYRQAGFKTRHYSIYDGERPEDIRKFYDLLISCKESENNTVVHCMGGNGRSGIVLAGILVLSGMSPDEAMAEVRKARPRAIENLCQFRFLYALQAYARSLV